MYLRKSSLISLVISIMIILNSFNTPVQAQSNNELLDLYKEYIEDETVIGLTHTGSKYTIMKKTTDYMRIVFSTDYEIAFDSKELSNNVGYSEDKISVSSKFWEDDFEQYLTLTFYPNSYDSNRDIASKIYNMLKEEYSIISAYACFDCNPVLVDYIFMWNHFEGIDKYGHRVTPEEELTKKQVENIRNEITANNFAVTINDDGKITFNESASETEKFRFALWLKEEYGFHVAIMNNAMFEDKIYNIIEILNYTDLSGDVNNDGYLGVDDTDMLREYILKGRYTTEESRPYVTFNTQNADLTGDGVIDVFDLVLLRKQLIDSK